MPSIGVLGSLNVDLTISLPRFHQPGETIHGTDFQVFTGGKGGNQAVAAAKLGVQTLMMGKLGADQNGDTYRKVMRNLGIAQDTVLTVEGTPSGVALIEVDATGENRIALVPGANYAVNRDMVDALFPSLLKCDILLMQLEIPMDTVEYAAQKWKAAGKPLLLDPAPAVPLGPDLLGAVSYLTPNETELQILTGMATDTEERVEKAARALLAQGVRCVIAKLGARGAMLVDSNQAVIVPGFSVNAVDTTAAGDSFNAGFAAALMEGKTPLEAVRFANAVAAISTTGMGAQSAMPNRAQVEAFLRKA